MASMCRDWRRSSFGYIEFYSVSWFWFYPILALFDPESIEFDVHLPSFSAGSIRFSVLGSPDTLKPTCNMVQRDPYHVVIMVAYEQASWAAKKHVSPESERSVHASYLFNVIRESTKLGIGLIGAPFSIHYSSRYYLDLCIGYIIPGFGEYRVVRIWSSAPKCFSRNCGDCKCYRVDFGGDSEGRYWKDLLCGHLDEK